MMTNQNILTEAGKLKPEADATLLNWEDKLEAELKSISAERVALQTQFRNELEALKIKRVNEKLQKGHEQS